ncbi:TPA: hypothetical protein JI077_05740 [Acinetobacter baumannii]|nr:hypothetical protein [Acinetobacter baumannii]
MNDQEILENLDYLDNYVLSEFFFILRKIPAYEEVKQPDYSILRDLLKIITSSKNSEASDEILQYIHKYVIRIFMITSEIRKRLNSKRYTKQRQEIPILLDKANELLFKMTPSSLQGNPNSSFKRRKNSNASNEKSHQSSNAKKEIFFNYLRIHAPKNTWKNINQVITSILNDPKKELQKLLWNHNSQLIDEYIKNLVKSKSFIALELDYFSSVFSNALERFKSDSETLKSIKINATNKLLELKKKNEILDSQIRLSNEYKAQYENFKIGKISYECFKDLKPPKGLPKPILIRDDSYRTWESWLRQSEQYNQFFQYSLKR